MMRGVMVTSRELSACRFASLPSSGGSVQEAAWHALAMAEHHRMQASGTYPPQDGEVTLCASCWSPSTCSVSAEVWCACNMCQGLTVHAAGQAAIAAAEARRAAMSTEGRGQPTGPMGVGLQRATSRTLSSGQEGAAAARAPGQAPGRRPDPFRMTIPPSAFRMEGRTSTGSCLPASMPQQAHIHASKVVDQRSMCQCGGPSRQKLKIALSAA